MRAGQILEQNTRSLSSPTSPKAHFSQSYNVAAARMSYRHGTTKNFVSPSHSTLDLLSTTLPRGHREQSSALTLRGSPKSHVVRNNLCWILLMAQGRRWRSPQKNIAFLETKEKGLSESRPPLELWLELEAEGRHVLLVPLDQRAVGLARGSLLCIPALVQALAQGGGSQLGFVL